MNGELKYETSEYVVAFIDILGAKEMIEKNPDSLQIVHDVYDIALDQLKAQDKSKYLDVFSRIFSDNIVLYTQVKADYNRFAINKMMAFCSVLMFSQFIQSVFFTKEILVRGGVTMGEFYEDEVMIWGKALVRAYELESKVALFPRIIIDPEKIAELKKQAFCPIKVDKDGMTYIDFLKSCIGKEKMIDCDFIYKKISENSVNVNILQKYNWVKNCIEELKKEHNK